MSDYKQPDFFHFGSDTIKLIQTVANSYPKDDPQKTHSLLDLGSGCGIIGLELSQKIFLSHLFLLEKESTFLPYLRENQKTFAGDYETHIVQLDWKDFNLDGDQKFSLIVSNPPYFMQGEGRESPDPKRSQARMWTLEDREEFINCAGRSLERNGHFFLLFRDRDYLMNHRTLKFKEIDRIAETFLFLGTHL